MDLRKFWLCWLRRGGLSQDELERIAVGDPDSTSDPGTANGYRACQFVWLDQTSQTLILPWSCTRMLVHQGQYLAGTGEQVAAVHPRLVPTATATSISMRSRPIARNLRTLYSAAGSVERRSPSSGRRRFDSVAVPRRGDPLRVGLRRG
jgi:hypothetical protein